MRPNILRKFQSWAGALAVLVSAALSFAGDTLMVSTSDWTVAWPTGAVYSGKILATTNDVKIAQDTVQSNIDALAVEDMTNVAALASPTDGHVLTYRGNAWSNEALSAANQSPYLLTHDASTYIITNYGAADGGSNTVIDQKYADDRYVNTGSWADVSILVGTGAQQVASGTQAWTRAEADALYLTAESDPGALLTNGTRAMAADLDFGNHNATEIDDIEFYNGGKFFTLSDGTRSILFYSAQGTNYYLGGGTDGWGAGGSGVEHVSFLHRGGSYAMLGNFNMGSNYLTNAIIDATVIGDGSGLTNLTNYVKVSGGTITGDLNLSSNYLTNAVIDATVTGDGSGLTNLTNYVQVSGDTMTGNLTLDDGSGAAPILTLTDESNNSATLHKQDGGTFIISTTADEAIAFAPATGGGHMTLNGGFHVGGETDPGNDNLKVDGNADFTEGYISNAIIDATVTGDGSGLTNLLFLPLAGGTMSGDINMGGNSITNMADGTADNHAATYAQATNAAILSGQLPAIDGSLLTGISAGGGSVSNDCDLTMYWVPVATGQTNDNMALIEASDKDATTEAEDFLGGAFGTTQTSAQELYACAGATIPYGFGAITNFVVWVEHNQQTNNPLVLRIADTSNSYTTTLSVASADTRTAVNIPATGTLTNDQSGKRLHFRAYASFASTNAAEQGLRWIRDMVRFQK